MGRWQAEEPVSYFYPAGHCIAFIFQRSRPAACGAGATYAVINAAGLMGLQLGTVVRDHTGDQASR